MPKISNMPPAPPGRLLLQAAVLVGSAIQTHEFAHDLIRKPVSTPDQVRGRLFRDHALAPRGRRTRYEGHARNGNAQKEASAGNPESPGFLDLVAFPPVNRFPLFAIMLTMEASGSIAWESSA